MKVVSIGGGPAGLYLAILLKKADPSHRITVLERNRPDDTFGFGVVFSDATLDNLQEADPESYARIVNAFYRWDDIDIHYRDEVLTSTGHGFAGFARTALLSILEDRCRELHVDIRHEIEVDSLEQFSDADLILGADGANSVVRDSLAEHFKPHIDWRPNKFVLARYDAAIRCVHLLLQGERVRPVARPRLPVLAVGVDVHRRGHRCDLSRIGTRSGRRRRDCRVL